MTFPTTSRSSRERRRRGTWEEEEDRKEPTHRVKVARDERVELRKRVLDVEDLQACHHHQQQFDSASSRSVEVEDADVRESENEAPTHLLVDGQDLGRRLEREARLGDVVVRRVDAQGHLAARERRGEGRLDVPARTRRTASATCSSCTTIRSPGESAASRSKGEREADALELAVGPRDEVGRHLGRLGERRDLPVVCGWTCAQESAS